MMQESIDYISSLLEALILGDWSQLEHGAISALIYL